MFAHGIRETEIRFVVLFPQGLWILKCIQRQCEIECTRKCQTTNVRDLLYLEICDVILSFIETEVIMWSIDAFLSDLFQDYWIFRLVMKLLIYSVSLLSMVSLARSGCTENQYGKDGCEPDPYLCRHIVWYLFWLLIMSCVHKGFIVPKVSKSLSKKCSKKCSSKRC